LEKYHSEKSAKVKNQIGQGKKITAKKFTGFIFLLLAFTMKIVNHIFDFHGKNN